MLIKRRRIRNLENYLGFLPKGTKVIIACHFSEVPDVNFYNIGFTSDLATGESVLPSANLGPICRYNAEGKYIKHKDQPKETVTRETEWRWTEFRGRHDREQRSKIVDVPYERYPRTFVPPPGFELSICLDTDGNKLVVSPELLYADSKQYELLHVINLFLELFRQCEVVSADLHSVIRSPERRLNWTVLPPGERPWEQLKAEVEPLIQNASKGNQPIIRFRLETINSYKPDFHAIGQAGFHGYIVFGFTKLDLFVLESIYFGNATYVFGHDWEELSKMTKAEILAGNLHIARFIHQKGWRNQLDEILSA